ncbi:MAG: TetR/AcrR family transcriptional regulator [Geodermatophilaceae bacterium]
MTASSEPTRIRRPRREDVRHRLLVAALDVFSRHGYDRTSLEQVAASAGFSKGAVYSNFASKDELFLALMDQQVQVRIDHAREALARERESGPVGQVVGDRLTVALAEDREWQLLFLDYVQRAARAPAVREQFAAHRQHVRGIIANAFREIADPAEKGASSLDVDQLATTVLALSNGLAIERLIDPDAVPGDLLGRILQILQPARE